MGRGTFQVSFELLKALLCLPDTVQIARVDGDPDGFTVTFYSDDIPKGDTVACKPILVAKERHGPYKETVFEGWGIE